MRSRLQLFHTWEAQLRQVVPDLRATQIRGLALLTLGLLWAEHVSLPRIAATLPLPATDASLERRLRRWLANRRVVVEDLWAQVLPALLASRPGRALTLVFDPTPHGDRFTLLSLGLVDHKRVLPVAWMLTPQHERWPVRQIDALRTLGRRVSAAVPPDLAVTLVADRGVTSAAVVDLCRELGWSFVLRLNAGASQAHRVRRADGTEHRLWDLVTGPGQHWHGPVTLFKEAGWRDVELTIHWQRHAPEPWLLIADQPTGAVRAYRRRTRCEATYEDCKERGWRLERSKLTHPERLNRLLLALHLALWWTAQLGHRAIRTGQRRVFDRADRRDLGLLRLGRLVFTDLLLHDRLPPLPFRCQPSGCRYVWFS
jgi:hypothetical protein